MSCQFRRECRGLVRTELAEPARDDGEEFPCWGFVGLGFVMSRLPFAKKKIAMSAERNQVGIIMMVEATRNAGKGGFQPNAQGRYVVVRRCKGGVASRYSH